MKDTETILINKERQRSNFHYLNNDVCITGEKIMGDTILNRQFTVSYMSSKQ